MVVSSETFSSPQTSFHSLHLVLCFYEKESIWKRAFPKTLRSCKDEGSTSPTLTSQYLRSIREYRRRDIRLDQIIPRDEPEMLPTAEFKKKLKKIFFTIAEVFFLMIERSTYLKMFIDDDDAFFLFNFLIDCALIYITIQQCRVLILFLVR